MADMGFLPEVTELLAKTPADGQRLLFSATLDGDVDALVRRFLTDPVTHSIDAADGLGVHDGPPRAADPAARQVRRSPRRSPPGRAARSCSSAPSSASTGWSSSSPRSAYAPVALHGGKTQRVRTRTLAEFREGRSTCWSRPTSPPAASTSTASPGACTSTRRSDPKDYLHRAGRTARAGESGTVVTLVLPKQRRSTLAMLEKAGVAPAETRVRVGDPALAELTGARSPAASGDRRAAAPGAVRARRGGPPARSRRAPVRPAARAPTRGDRTAAPCGDRPSGSVPPVATLPKCPVLATASTRRRRARGLRRPTRPARPGRPARGRPGPLLLPLRAGHRRQLGDRPVRGDRRGRRLAAHVRMERAAGRWRVTTGEQGDLDAALRAAGQRRPCPASRSRPGSTGARRRPRRVAADQHAADPPARPAERRPARHTSRRRGYWCPAWRSSRRADVHGARRGPDPLPVGTFPPTSPSMRTASSWTTPGSPNAPDHDPL